MMSSDPTAESTDEGEPVEVLEGDESPASDEVIDAEIVEAETVTEAHTDSSNAAIDQDTVLSDVSEEMVVGLIAERDEYLDALQRLKAEFANARRRNDEQAVTLRKQAATELVDKLLPVLDSCDAALGQGIEAVGPIATMLFDTLAAQGLSRLESTGTPFDPELHDAVMHEDGDGEPTVAETLRTGYLWNDKVIRPAMVKVQG